MLLNTHPKLRACKRITSLFEKLAVWCCQLLTGPIQDGSSDLTSEAVTDRVGTGCQEPSAW